MDKKHISVFGSCVTRSLFNNELLKSIFTIDKYCFQICPWDLFNNSLELNKEEIYKEFKEDFTARMVWYDLNKVTIKELESVKSEYLIIDFYYVVAANIEKVCVGDKFIYCTQTADRYWNIKQNPNNKLKLNVEVIDNKKNCLKEKEDGLNAFANWIKSNYDLSKVVLLIPSFADKFYDIDNNLHEYENSEGKKMLLQSVYNYTLKFAEKLDNKVKIFDLSKDNVIAQYGNFDNITKLKTPPYMHLTDYEYIKQSKKLLKLLNLEYDSKLTSVNLLKFETIKYRNLYIKSINMQNIQNNDAGNSLYKINLNQYIERIENLNDFIIVISAKDEPALNIGGFESKKILGINCNIKFRDSYIAIIDKKRNFVYENSSCQKIEYAYKVGNSKINVVSAGWNAGNFSSIKVNEKEYSKNNRGLNIVLFNSETLEFVDSINCDTFGDKKLIIESDYLKNVKIKK